ncbi:terminase small subunit [Dokdonella sp.]|uniref:terminase small subunit n=1 Tax=Dokdonella sp. TaxID=2291710 RepID=UPI002DD66AF3|nr:terminase small subunit [Dokdonella sp.]
MTPKQAAFVDEYLIDLNATQAAIRAGYSAKTAEWIGPQLLGKAHVSAAIAKRMEDRSKRTEITQDRVLTDIELIKQDAMRKAYDKNGNEAMINHTSALKACELQGRHLQMWNDKVALTIETTTDEELHARIADLARKAGITSAII